MNIIEKEIDGIKFHYYYKNIKHLRLTVKQEKVIVSIPCFLNDEIVNNFICSKLELIKKHIEKCSYKHIKHEYIQGETFYIWGNPYKLIVKESSKNRVKLNENNLVLSVKDNISELKQKLIETFYREQTQKKALVYLKKWTEITGIEVSQMRTRKMKTRWGSCNIQQKRIWLSINLAHYDEQCLSYVVLHEILHIIERNHNKRFYALLDKYKPDWKETRKILSNGYKPY